MLKTLPTLTTAALLAATGALAQEAAPTPQEIEATYTWSAIDVIPTMPMGEGRDVFLIESFLVFSSANDPLAGLAGRCFVMGENDLATFGYTEAGTCVYQDANGDQLWARFEGASGEVDYENTFSASPRAGLYQGTGTQRGTLILPVN